MVLLCWSIFYLFLSGETMTSDQQFVIATESTPILIVAALSFFHPFAAAY
jgi:hypothetical protein